MIYKNEPIIKESDLSDNQKLNNRETQSVKTAPEMQASPINKPKLRR